MMINKLSRVILLSLGIVVFSNVQANEDSLHQAVLNQDIDRIELLLMQGADINELGSFLYDHGSPLHVAVRDDSQEMVALLLVSGAEVDVRDSSDHTPLHNAAWNGYLDIIELLLDAGADIHASTYSGRTPLSCARSGRQTDAIQFIEGKLKIQSN